MSFCTCQSSSYYRGSWRLLSPAALLEQRQQACVIDEEQHDAQNNWLTSMSSAEKIKRMH